MNGVHWFRKASAEQLGDFGEKFWSKLFAACDLSYIPLFQSSISGAPMQRGKNTLILPDFQVNHRGTTVFADSKAKRGPVLWRHWNQWRHGINRSNYNHYREISDDHRSHCVLAVFECFTDEKDKASWSGSAMVQTLDRLGTPYNGQGPSGHMVYWPKDSFRFLARFHPDNFQGQIEDPALIDTIRDNLQGFLQDTGKKPVQGLLF